MIDAFNTPKLWLKPVGVGKRAGLCFFPSFFSLNGEEEWRILADRLLWQGDCLDRAESTAHFKVRGTSRSVSNNDMDSQEGLRGSGLFSVGWSHGQSWTRCYLATIGLEAFLSWRRNRRGQRGIGD